MEPFVYLASQSPRRRQLLEQIGVRYTLLLANGDDAEPEDPEALEAVLPKEIATDYVQRVTGLKLDAALARMQRRCGEHPVGFTAQRLEHFRRLIGRFGFAKNTLAQ